MSKTKQKIYEAMDSFLVGASERSVERLNQDRHLFVEKMEKLLAIQRQQSEKYLHNALKEAKDELDEVCEGKLRTQRQEIEMENVLDQTNCDQRITALKAEFKEMIEGMKGEYLIRGQGVESEGVYLNKIDLLKNL